MKTANRLSISTVAFLIGLGTMPALAQTANDDAVSANVSGNNISGNVRRGDNLSGNTAISAAREQALVTGDVNAENSIEQGVKSGQLTSAEAARLEQGQARIDQSESAAFDSGRLSSGEVNRIDRAQTAEDNRITALDNNSMTVTPGASSNRLAADVQRDANQETRIDKGIANGSLTAQEAGKLEQGQARLDSLEARDGRNDNLSGNEQQAIQADANTQSTDIHTDRHNNNNNNNVMTVSDSTRQRWTDHRGHGDDYRYGQNSSNDNMTVASTNSSNVLVSGSNAQTNTSSSSGTMAVGGTTAVGGATSVAVPKTASVTPHVMPHVAPTVAPHHK